MIPKRLTKRERLAAIMAEIDTSQIRELPEEADAPVEITTSEIGVAKSITIVQDGKLLTGSGWTLPEDYIDEDIASGRLVSLKGTTPPTLPGLDAAEAADAADVDDA